MPMADLLQYQILREPRTENVKVICAMCERPVAILFHVQRRLQALPDAAVC